MIVSKRLLVLFFSTMISFAFPMTQDAIKPDELRRCEGVRSKKVFFISECLLNQNIRAYGVRNMKGEGSLAPLVLHLVSLGAGIDSVSCPEITYEGLIRKACGKCKYRTEAYEEICYKRAREVVGRYKLYLSDGYKVGGFICVNGSPSCACDYCFSGTKCGRIKEPGVFIEVLQRELGREGLLLNFIGIDIWNLGSALVKISDAIR